MPCDHLQPFVVQQRWTEASVEVLVFKFFANGLLRLLPLHTERRIGEHVIEHLMRVSVIGEGVTGLDIRNILALDEHVRFADGVRLVIQLLAEYSDP